jgi:pseudaminic acid cytidylyltransferase
MNVAIIPARGGSKRIPRKNIKEFCGKPMIAWSIEAALNNASIDRVVVSTDDCEIAEISRAFGAEVPFIRPDSLADDFTGTVPVIKHAVESLIELGAEFSNVCCIYATAPFVNSGDLDEGLRKLINYDCDYVFSVTSYAFPIQRAIKLSENHHVEMFFPENYDKRSQDLEEAWHDAGQFYWGNKMTWLSELPLFSSKSMSIILPRYRVQDIDTFEDWVRAEWLLKSLMAKSKI